MSKQQTTVTIAVKMILPKGANGATALDYVRSAVASHAGGLDPKDVMFELDREKTVVKLIKKETNYA